MSSSRIIKSGTSRDQPVADFCFNSFQKRPGQDLSNANDGFMPFFHDIAPRFEENEDTDSPVGASSLEEENEIPGMIRINEDELQKRIQEAFEKGVEEERRQADDDLAGIYSALSEAISIVSRLRERIVRESEDDLLSLAFMVAKKIVRQEIKHDRQILVQLVSEALRGFTKQHDIVVSLNPEDYKVITSNKELFLSGIGSDRQITLKSDEATTLGGCVVESSTGVIDARIEAQLDEIYKGLIEERNSLCDLSDTKACAPTSDEELIA
jgi:flagellar assembly protein FliH